METVLFVLDFWEPYRGGSERVFSAIVKSLLDAGKSVVVVTSRRDKNLPVVEKHWNLKIFRVGRGRADFAWKSFWKISAILKSQEISVVHTTSCAGAIAAWLAAKFFGKKIVLTLHELFGESRWRAGWRAGFRGRIFEKVLLGLVFEKYRVVSQSTRRQLAKFKNPQKIVLLRNRVDRDFRRPASVAERRAARENLGFRGDEKVLFFYGHAGFSKGFGLISQVLSEISAWENLRFVFCFAGPQRDLVAKEFVHGFGKFEIFSGISEEKLREVLWAVDLVVAPSRAEGFGFVQAETALAGQKLLTTRVAAIPEVCRGETIFVDPEDSVELQEKISDFLVENCGFVLPREFDGRGNFEEYSRAVLDFYADFFEE